MKLMILGITGMLGNAMLRVLSERSDLDVYGTARSNNARQHFSNNLAAQIIVDTDVENNNSLVRAFAAVRPDVVVNCIGLVKQLVNASDPLQAISINSLLPHRLAVLCQATGARFIHVSSDCVFSGAKGNYLETDFPDPYDLYGRSKLLGEVDYPHTITLRTSLIGHELSKHLGLVDWFLAQKGAVKGFTHTIFSGLPNVELATVVRDVVLPHTELHGLYHISSKPINKFDLLQMLAHAYGKDIEINPSEEIVIDRSLNSDRFKEATGYVPPEWPTLIQRMCEFK